HASSPRRIVTRMSATMQTTREVERRPLFALLEGLVSERDAALRGPACRGELGDAPKAKAGLELLEDVDEIVAYGDPGALGRLHERVRVREARCAFVRAREEKVLPAERDATDLALDPPVVDLESAIAEAATEVRALAGRVSQRLAERRGRRDRRPERVDPRVELVEERQRALGAEREPIGRRESFGRGLDRVEVGEELERTLGTHVTRQHRRVESSTDVH